MNGVRSAVSSPLKKSKKVWGILLLVSVVLSLPAFAPSETAVPKRLALSIVTYNIRYGALGIPGLLQTLQTASPDIVFLQEVHGPPFLTRWENQADTLARSLRLEASFGRARLWTSGEYGLATLSRFPVKETIVVPLPVQPDEEPEILLATKIETPHGPLMLLNAHLTARAHGRGNRARKLREAQASAILDWASGVTIPLLFGGDLNTFGISTVKRMFRRQWIDLFKAEGRGCGSTFPAKFPLVTLDYLFARGPFEVWESRVLRSTASDHRPLWARLEWVPEDPKSGTP